MCSLLLLNTPTPATGPAEYAGLVGVLIAGIVVLWRALQKKDDQLQTLTKQVITHTDNLLQIPQHWTG